MPRGRHWVLGLVLLTIACTLAILLFPLASGHGPYPVTHGPVTSLKAIRAGFQLRLAMVSAGFCPFSVVPYAGYFLVWFGFALAREIRDHSDSAQPLSILRC
jgi:hypothetical protein